MRFIASFIKHTFSAPQNGLSERKGIQGEPRDKLEGKDLERYNREKLRTERGKKGESCKEGNIGPGAKVLSIVSLDITLR